MIIVTGEALIDLVLLDGHVAAQPQRAPAHLLGSGRGSDSPVAAAAADQLEDGAGERAGDRSR